MKDVLTHLIFEACPLKYSHILNTGNQRGGSAQPSSTPPDHPSSGQCLMARCELQMVLNIMQLQNNVGTNSRFCNKIPTLLRTTPPTFARLQRLSGSAVGVVLCRAMCLVCLREQAS